MTLELFGASVAAVTEFHIAHGFAEVSGPFPIVVQTTGEAVPSRVRTTCWHAATRCFGERGFMLKVGKKLQAAISIKLGWANIDLRPWRSSGSRPGNSLPSVFPIHGEIGDSAICRIDEVMGGITAMNGVPCSTVWHERVTEDNTIVLSSRNHRAVAAQRYAVEQCAGKILIQIGPLLSGIRRSYDAAVIANVHRARSRLREGDRSLVGVDEPN